MMVIAPVFVFGIYLPRFVTRVGGIDRARCARSDTPLPLPPGHLTVVVVDGLGFEYAMALEELAWLRREAAVRPLQVEFPSFTTPALVSFATGLGPSHSGVRLNAPTRAVTRDIDNLMASAESAGRAIDVFDGGWKPFGEIMFADGDRLWKGRRTMEAAPFISRADKSLRLIYVGDVDTAGHEHGRDSEAYRRAAVRASSYLRRHFELLGADDRLLVVSDHGHLAAGGHGGIEPEILHATFAVLGRNARRGAVLPPRAVVDVAPTIATLAGIPTPGCNLGRPMLDMLALDATTSAQLSRHVDDQRERLEQHIVDRIDENRALRLAVALAASLALFTILRRRLPPLRAWSAPVAFIFTYTALLMVRGYRLTFSKMPPQESFIFDASAACVVAALVVYALVRWRRLVGADVALLVGVVLPMVWMNAWVGADPRFTPTPYVGLAVILWSPMWIGAALAAIVVASSRVSGESRRAETDPAPS